MACCDKLKSSDESGDRRLHQSTIDTSDHTSFYITLACAKTSLRMSRLLDTCRAQHCICSPFGLQDSRGALDMLVVDQPFLARSGRQQRM